MLPFSGTKSLFAVFIVFGNFTPLVAWLWNGWSWNCTKDCTIWNVCMFTRERDVSICGQSPENCICDRFAVGLGILNRAQLFRVEKCDLNKLYCGRELSRMSRWFIKRYDHVFQCVGATEVTTVRRCERACVNNGVALCSCAMGQNYCWRELEQLGYSDLQQNAWYKCLANGIIEKGDECGDGAQCTDVNKCKASIPCIHGMSYCGFQLYDFVSKLTELNNNTLYICHEGSPMVYKECSSTCLRRAATQVAICSPRCQVDRLYCGHELEDSSLNPNAIYACEANGSIVEHERCAHACINIPHASCTKQCDENTTYCGHELQQMAFDFDDLVAQALYWCQSPQNIVFLQHCTDGCIEGEASSACLPDNQPIGEFACGTPHADEVHLLVREGQVATRRLWPWLVSLQGRTGFDEGHFCGGVLLNNEWVLTAAHCLSHIIQWIIIGEYDLWRHDRGQVNATIAREFPHPNYTRVPIITNDIALLKLAQPIQYGRFVKPICLPTSLDATQIGKKYAFAGWGETYGNLHPHILRNGTQEILSTSVCASISTQQIFDEGTMICAGQTDESDTVACGGDSGGPLVGRNTHGSYVVHGLVSYSRSDVCRLTTKMYGVYTKVSPYVQWIQQTIARET